MKFFIQILSASSFTLIVASTAPAQGAPIYSLTDLGTLGGQFSLANAINDAGQIVGVAETANGEAHATLFNTGGANIDLGTIGGHSSSAHGINDAGQIVGVAETAGNEAQEGHSHERHATLFNTTGDANQDLGTLGGQFSIANAINDAGQIVGVAGTAKGETHATLFNTTGGANQDLGTLGGEASEASTINNAGQIAGAALTTDGETHATLFSTSDGNQDLGTLSGQFSRASAINDAGQVVGAANIDGGDNHATLFSSDGNQDLGILGSDTSTAFTYANAINDNGQIVGRGATGAGLFESLAFLFEGGKLYDLHDLIDPTDPLFGDVLLVSATDINNAGQIVGFGFFVTNSIPSAVRAFQLTPVAVAVPEPAALTLITVGGAGLTGFSLLARRRRPS
jgi:probable HAF family extracellular repeat protein